MASRTSNSVAPMVEAGLAKLRQGPLGLVAARIRLETPDSGDESGGDEVLVFWLPKLPPRLPTHIRAQLSPAEQAVAMAVLAGHGNAAIAAQRNASLRTVCNQVARIFRKLEISSRLQLTALCTECE